jgi:phospholipid/cholesterol/gamma-HCH transport system substrate-binding protein
MNRYYKEALVGLLVLIGLALFISGSLWLRSRSIGGHGIPVVYSAIGNLKDAAPVRISGAQVGRVEKIVFLAPGRVVAGVNIDNDRVRVTRNARAVIGSVGMLGDAVIDLDPGTGPELTEGDTLRGAPPAPGLFDIAGEMAGKASTTLTALNRMLDTNLVVELRGAIRRSNALMAYFADPVRGPTAEVNPTMRQLQSAAARFDTALAGLDVAHLQTQVDSSLRSTRKLTDRLASMSERMDTILARIERGQGTLGKLSTDTLLYTDIRGLTQSMNRLVDEIAKNPGKIGVTVRIP